MFSVFTCVCFIVKCLSTENHFCWLENLVQKNEKRFTPKFFVNRFPNLHNPPPLFSFSLAQTQPPLFSLAQKPHPLSALARTDTPSRLARTDPAPFGSRAQHTTPWASRWSPRLCGGRLGFAVLPPSRSESCVHDSVRSLFLGLDTVCGGLKVDFFVI